MTELGKRDALLQRTGARPTCGGARAACGGARATCSRTITVRIVRNYRWMPRSESDRNTQSTLAQHRGADLRHRCLIDFHDDHIDKHFGLCPIKIVNEFLD